jgi:hypothetical protein
MQMNGFRGTFAEWEEAMPAYNVAKIRNQVCASMKEGNLTKAERQARRELPKVEIPRYKVFGIQVNPTTVYMLRYRDTRFGRYYQVAATVQLDEEQRKEFAANPTHFVYRWASNQCDENEFVWEWDYGKDEFQQLRLKQFPFDLRKEEY